MSVGASIQARLLGPLEIEHAGRPWRPAGGPSGRCSPGCCSTRTARCRSTAWSRTCGARRRRPAAPKMVQIYVSMLRKALPPGVLVTRSPGYAIELPPESIDLVRFESLPSAAARHSRAGYPAVASDLLLAGAALWRGPALAEFQEPFAEIEARRLEERRLAAHRGPDRRRPGARRDATPDRRAGGARCTPPAPGAPAGQLMVALYRAGRQADALRAPADAGRSSARSSASTVATAPRAGAPDPAARSGPRASAPPRPSPAARLVQEPCRSPGVVPWSTSQPALLVA